MSWPQVALDSICEINVGRTPSRYKSAYWEDGIHPWVSISDMSQSRRISQTKESISEQARVECNMKPVAPGTVLMSFKLSIGKISFADRELYTNEAIAALPVLDAKQLDTAYLARALEALDFSDTGNRAVMGMTLNKAGLKKVKIPLPPLDEQKRIAAILDQADELRRKRQRAIDRLNQLRQALFHEMFGDFVTNPMGWSTVKLGDACGVGSSKRVFVDEFVDEGVPFYRGTEVGKLATGDFIEPDLFIEPNHYADLIAHSGKPEIGDLLLPSICHDGRIWRVDNDRPFYFKDGRVLWIKKNEAIFDSEYLRNHLRNAFLTNYHTIASGTTFAELKIVNLKGLSVLCPPLKLQVEFSKRIREVETTSLEMANSASVANTLFASLQHRAFLGEL